MSLTAVWSEGYLAHDASWLVWAGARLPGDEEKDRAEALLAALDGAGVPIVPAEAHGKAPIEAVHDPAMVDYLESAHREWVGAGYSDDPGSDLVVAYAFRHPTAFGAYPARVPRSRAAMAGVYCMDTATTIGPGTYVGARAAVDGALTAAALVMGGARSVYAPVRPPGHHAGTDYFGGSCYLNNVAVAAQWLIAQGVATVAIVDIDAHHGNGTQQVFYRRSDVFYASVHVDPGQGWFPHWCGFADERGEGPGLGANLNLPLPPGSGDEEVVLALETAVDAVSQFQPEVLLVSLGVDSGASDPESPLQVTPTGFAAMGSALGSLDLPTVLVQEGGYDLGVLGRDVLAVLGPFQDL
jgi:acetoin utilization deacetylase AcuC-like enzyme